MEKSKFELDEEKAKHSTLKSRGQEKKPRRVAVKNAKFYLYEKEGITPGKLIPIGDYETKTEMLTAYGDALDSGSGIPEEGLVVFKGRFEEITVTQTKRRITVR